MTESASNVTETADSEFADDEISLLDLAIVLAKHKWLVVGLPLVVAVLSVFYALSLPPIFTATTKILPPQQSQSSAAAMLAQLGGLAGLAGGAVGLKNPNDIFIGMVTSRTVADSMIKRFGLNDYYQSELQSQTRATLEANTQIAAGKDGIITIDVDDKDPKRAADMANAYVEELTKLTRTLAVTEASQRRLFFENQLQQTRDALNRAEVAAKQAMESGGLTSVDAQGRALLETTARLRGQISVKEVQIGSMRTFAAERNPDLLQAQQELAAMKIELAKIEGARGTDDVAHAKGRGFENLGLLRDVKYYETVYELFAKQYEIAKMDEAKDSAIIQVMDKAIEPDQKSKPRRSVIVLLSTFIALFVGIFLAFIREAIEKAQQDPESARRLTVFWNHLRLRR